MIGFEDILRGVLAPAAVAAVVFACVRWCASRVPAERAGALAWAASVVCGYAAGHWALEAAGPGLQEAVAKSFRPHQARDWLPLAVLAFAFIDVVPLDGKKRVGTWLGRAAVCGALAWRMLSLHRDYPTSELVRAGLSETPWSWTGIAVACAVLIAIGLCLWQMMASSRSRPHAWILAGLAAAAAGGAGATLALSGSLFYAQLLGALAATLGGTGVAMLATRTAGGPGSAAGPILAGFCGLLLMAVLFTDDAMGIASATVLLTALTLGTTALPAKIPTRAAESVRAVVCLALIGAVVGIAASRFAASIEPVQPTEEAAPNPYSQYQG
ncbi:MAG: hypothetical protein AAGA92_04435 [Planctomycetota bacterium]